MTDDEVRALVRAAVERHLGARPAPASADPVRPVPPPAPISFGRYALPRDPDDSMCLIEPAVRCNHCGYCQCHGH